MSLHTPPPLEVAQLGDGGLTLPVILQPDKPLPGTPGHVTSEPRHSQPATEEARIHTLFRPKQNALTRQDGADGARWGEG